MFFNSLGKHTFHLYTFHFILITLFSCIDTVDFRFFIKQHYVGISVGFLLPQRIYQPYFFLPAVFFAPYSIASLATYFRGIVSHWRVILLRSLHCFLPLGNTVTQIQRCPIGNFRSVFSPHFPLRRFSKLLFYGRIFPHPSQRLRRH